ncbi:MAG: general stress protein [Clostridiaceae bacterium]
MKKIIGIFNTEEKAIKAVEQLRADGYTDEEISVVTSNRESYDRLSRVVGDEIVEDQDSTRASAGGAATGAATGGTIGGIGGLLLGLGALAIPGVGPIVAAGPIAAAIGGALAGGAIGGIAGALIDNGVPEDEAKEYEERIKEGDIMVLVDDDEARRESVYSNFSEHGSYNRDRYRMDENRRNPSEEHLNSDDPLASRNRFRD